LWHGHEFEGFENIPDEGGALIIWFHGAMPVDYFALVVEVWARQRRLVKSVIDRSPSLKGQQLETVFCLIQTYRVK